MASNLLCSSGIKQKINLNICRKIESALFRFRNPRLLTEFCRIAYHLLLHISPQVQGIRFCALHNFSLQKLSKFCHLQTTDPTISKAFNYGTPNLEILLDKILNIFVTYKLNMFFELVSLLCLCLWVPVNTAWCVLRLRMEERPPMWRVAANK